MAAADASPDTIIEQFLTVTWWAMLLRGIAAVLFGILSFAWPEISLQTLMIVFGVYVIMDGAFLVGAAFKGGVSRYWLLLLNGVLGIGAGVIAMAWPGLTAIVLVFVIGWWAIFSGIVAIVLAIRVRREIENEWLLILSGILSVLFGAALLIAPGAGALALIWLIALWALVFGALMIVLAFRLRKLRTL
ncbi:HdeD family acid-resistance protein [Hyphomonas sp.]|uniref:HdeD family acid-resistance protein n=1 Tax=Hyphomonas sp. TaxID=87 RepID=UPI0030F76F5E